MDPKPDDEYLRPELFDLGDAAELTRGGGSDEVDNPNGDTKQTGSPS
jgi:hypothetical protein